MNSVLYHGVITIFYCLLLIPFRLLRYIVWLRVGVSGKVAGRAVGVHQRAVDPANRTMDSTGKLAVEPLGMPSSRHGHPLTLCTLPTHNPILWMVFHMCFQ